MPPLTRRAALLGLPLLGLGGFGGAAWWMTSRRGAAAAEALYATPLMPPEGPLRTYHLGHSLVGRDMPAMLAQLAGHSYESQLGWGTSLREHWDPALPVNGFEKENAHDRYRDGLEAVGSGEYDALVLTEMVELKDAIRYHDSAKYLANWAQRAAEANPDTRIYLYETWHHTDDPGGWATRIAEDYEALWLRRVLYPALATSGAPVHVIPAGQAMATFVAKVAEDGGIGGIKGVDDLFATSEDGTPDTIHFNDVGAYLVALTHYAVLYHRTPEGLPHQLTRADGTPATAPSAEAARAMQEVVWQVVTGLKETGVAG